MKSTEQIKREIAQDLRAFRSPVRIAHPRAGDLMKEVMQEYPEVFFYVKSYSGSVTMSGPSSCATYRVIYSDTEIARDRVFRVDDRDDVESKLHESVAAYRSVLALCVPSSVDTDKIYHDFMVSYGGFYSNLMDVNCETKSFSGARVQYAVFRFRYRIGRVKLNMMERAVDQEVERLAGKLFAPEMSKEVKAYVAHNYLAKKVEYWLKEEANPLEKSYMQSAYGALINHRCVCQGYAEAYKRLLDSQGIICEVICGKIRGSQEYHAWNVISFDGRNYYHVDVTWDSRGEGAVDWSYFCKSDREMSADRIWTRRSGVVCASTADILSLARRQITAKKLGFLAKGVDRAYL